MKPMDRDLGESLGEKKNEMIKCLNNFRGFGNNTASIVAVALTTIVCLLL